MPQAPLRILTEYVRNRLKCYVLLGIVCLWSLYITATESITVWSRTYDNPRYYQQLNQLLSLTHDHYGPYTLVRSDPVEQGRVFASLRDGQHVDVMVAGIDQQREADTLTLYYPLDQGMLGVRLCLINPASQPTLSSLTGLDDMQQHSIRFGLGSHWPDNQILTANGLVVVHTPVYRHLFSMLAKARFDCFLRGIQEISTEHAMYPHFAIEHSFVVLYPYGHFVFVSPHSPQLYARLSLGLQRKLAMSSTELSNPREKALFFQFKLHQRQPIFLTNPYLSSRAREAINQHGTFHLWLSSLQKNRAYIATM